LGFAPLTDLEVELRRLAGGVAERGNDVARGDPVADRLVEHFGTTIEAHEAAAVIDDEQQTQAL